MSYPPVERTTRAPRPPAAGLPAAGALAALLLLMTSGAGGAGYVWVEGEKPARSTMHRHPWWYDQVKRDQLSGGDFLSNWDEKRAGEAVYTFQSPGAGSYEFWVRANPLQATLSYRLNGGPWTPIDLEKEQQGNTNIAADGKPDLRFIAWVRVGKVTLARGANSVAFRMDSANNHHGMLDCFVFSAEPFTPRGAARPDQVAALARRATEENRGWFAFAPKADRFSPASGIDLRSLNEKTAGEGGFIGVKGGQFVHTKTGRPVRFWAVNGPPGKDRESLQREARVLAKRGVNLVRVHHPYFQKNGDVNMDDVRHAIEVVEAMKAEGIYTHFSIYFPLWLDPPPDTPWLPGYDGKTHAFASLYFNKDFQEKYRSWWRALLLTPSPSTGKRLVDEPAVASVEIVNEDSYFFWTFDRKTIPDAEMRIVEGQFAAWVKARFGGLEAARQRWGGFNDDRDKPAEGRVALRPLWNIANERTQRDKDTARFLTESQRGFYRDTEKFLRETGFKGAVTASNWATADARVLDPLERYTYTACDFIDRHGYFGGFHKGEAAEWSVREGHVYADRSALRFDPAEPGKPRLFNNPVMDIGYDGKPSMTSEISFNRPNRYRSEAPLYLAAYAALQGTDAVVQFALDGSSWSTKPGFFVQPWTLMSPAVVGQFPAAALIFRKGLVAEGDLLVDLTLKPADLFDLKGTPLPLDASFDELRLKDVPRGAGVPRPGQVIDPLLFFAGRANVNFREQGGPNVVKDLRPYIDHARRTVVSTHRQLRLDYGKGVLAIDAPAAQGVCGNLGAAGTTELTDLSVTSTLEVGHIVAVSLDGKPLSASRKVLLQVMTEEKPYGYRTEPAGPGLNKIVDLGRDPWLVRRFEGTVRLKRSDAARLKVTALDENGEPLKAVVGADKIRLGSQILYYLIEPSEGVASAR